MLNKRNRSFILRFFFTIAFILSAQANNILACKKAYNGREYTELKKNIATGWNTWNTKSVLSHVLLPHALALNIELYDAESGKVLEYALTGRQGGENDIIEKVSAGSRTYDGSYTSLIIQWRNIKVRIESAAKDNSLSLVITPIEVNADSYIRIKPTILWGREGTVDIKNNEIICKFGRNKIDINAQGNLMENINDSVLIFSLSQKVALSTNRKDKLVQIENKIETARTKHELSKSIHSEYKDVYEPMQEVLAWNTIYEPTEDRVISLVSQVWSIMWNGFMFPVWDTYFGAYMLSLDNKELAYSNALAITNAVTKNGFVPNVSTGYGKSEDRSQPPVGSFVIKELYKNYKEKWVLYEAFDKLLSWNRWWDKNRNYDDYLCWGSNSNPDFAKNHPLAYGVHESQGALYESGLDNSSMYDGIPFNKEKNLLMIADVGLMSLYVLDCNSLADIADEIEKPEIANELRVRAKKYSVSLQRLWNEDKGIFMNKRLDNNTFSNALSPTLFYPLTAGVATQHQAERMIREHFYNKEEFWGEYIMPCTARNEEAFKDNHYFRGRIWPPMNFIVYLGLRKYNVGNSTKDMVEKSKTLLLKSWELKRDVYENYGADTGLGFDVGSSQGSYYWGALLGFMSLIESNQLPSPELPISKLKK